MQSQSFIRTRAAASCNAQQSIFASAGWLWPLKTQQQWADEVTLLFQLQSVENVKRIAWRMAAEAWENDLIQIQQIARDLKRNALVHFRADASKLKLFESLNTDGEGRKDIYDQCSNARDVWQAVAAAWVFSDEVSLAGFSSLLSSCLARQSAHGVALTKWREAATALTNKSKAVDLDNVAWYAEATNKFPAGTNEGDLIRSTVPTTTRQQPPVEQAVITNLMVSGGEIHIDASAEHATRYTYLHQSPGAAVFLVEIADTPSSSLTLHGQLAGVHRFKVVGSNSDGEGPESAVAEAAVAQGNAA